MSSLFDIGKSGLQSYRQSLAVTGQNIANINTDGYKRREAGLEEITASQGGITGIANQSGLGVRIEAIRRSFDAYLVDRNRSAESYFEAESSFLNKLKELEDMMLPSDSNLGIVMGRFFNSLQDEFIEISNIAFSHQNLLEFNTFSIEGFTINSSIIFPLTLLSTAIIGIENKAPNTSSAFDMSLFLTVTLNFCVLILSINDL